MASLLTDLRIAGRNLRRNTKRTRFAVLTVAMGIIAYLFAAGFIQWIFDSMREATIRSQLGHIQIIRPGYFKKGMADPYNFILPPASPELAAIGGTAGVVTVSQRLALSGLASHGDTTVSFIGEGVEPEREAVISDDIKVSAGRNLGSSSEKAAFIGEGLAQQLGVKPGDRIVLLVTAASGAPNAVEVEVAGLFKSVSKEFDDTALRLPIDVARKLMRVTGATTWVVLLDDTDRTATALEELRALLPHERFEVTPWSDLADFYNKTVLLYGKQINLMRYIIALLVVLTVSNTQTMSVLERTTEIGTIIALGQRTSGVLRMFLLEGILIGVVGGLVGTSAGWLLSVSISAVGIPMPPAPGMSQGFDAEITVKPAMLLDALVLALVTTLVATILPAVRAARMNVVDALRCNQ